MTAFLLPNGKQHYETAAGLPAVGWKIYTYDTGTNNPRTTWADAAQVAPNPNPVVLDARGEASIFWNGAYRVRLEDNLGNTIWTQDGVSYVDSVASLLSDLAAFNNGSKGAGMVGFGPVVAYGANTVGSFLNSLRGRNAAEIAAGVMPTNYFEDYGYFERYGAVGDGVTNDSAAINTALSIDQPCFGKAKTYRATTLSQTKNFQVITGFGDCRIQKNANGTLLTSSGTDVEFNGIRFRGGAAGPDFTGDGVIALGNNFRLINCGSRFMTGRAAKCVGSHVQIINTCDIYQTTDLTATGYDIELGASGSLTTYHSVENLYTSQPTGGILATDTGSLKIINSQFGKLTIAAGTSPPGVNGGNYNGNRINGDVSVSVSSATFAGNSFSSAAITFQAGTSGHSFDRSNVLQSGLVLTDNSNNSVVEDIRDVPYQTFTPTITASGGGFALGNGTVVGRFSKKGREVTVFIRFIFGGTTAFGAGFYTFSLPFIPNTTMECIGTSEMFDTSAPLFRTGNARSGSAGTATMFVSVDSGIAFCGAAVPFAWAAGDEWRIALTYFTAS